MRYADLREETLLIINGKARKGSRFDFSNGPHPVDEFLKPGGKYQFGYRYTPLFKKPGRYKVVWRGRYFETSTSFSVVRPRK